MTKSEKIEHKGYHVEKHGHNKRGNITKTYNTWASMIKRCTNPKDKSFIQYGGNGIKVCKRWRKFENFLEDMGTKPLGLSIDRVNNLKGYSKENCRWATREQQNRNRSNVINITFEGKTMSLAEWAREIGIDRETLSSRIKRGIKLPELFNKTHGNKRKD